MLKDDNGMFERVSIKGESDSPKDLYTLKGIGPNNIKGSAGYRIHGMFPVLTYYDKKRDIALWRGAMPRQ
jgi:hypothetical protein